jgi:hypothetical protein
VQVGEYGRLKEQLLSQEELQASLSTKVAQLEASQARASELELQLAQALEQSTSQSQRLATLQVSYAAWHDVHGHHSGYLAEFAVMRVLFKGEPQASGIDARPYGLNREV